MAGHRCYDTPVNIAADLKSGLCRGRTIRVGIMRHLSRKCTGSYSNCFCAPNYGFECFVGFNNGLQCRQLCVEGVPEEKWSSSER